MTGQLALLPDCVIPGCHLPVTEAAQACPECIAAFGPYLREAPEATPTVEAISDGDRALVEADTAARRAAAAPGEPERKANQRCWMCEERRTCERTPQGWECRECREVR